MKKNHKITNSNNRRLSLQIVAGTLLIQVCGNGIAPTLAFSVASTEPITLGNDCTQTLPPSRTESLIKPASPLVAGNLLPNGCSNGIAPNRVAGLAKDCTKGSAPSQGASFIKAVSPVPKSQRLKGLKASNPKLSPLAQEAQVANNALQSINQVAIVDGNLVKLDQQLNSQLPNAISQGTQDLCDVGSGATTCDTGAGVLCETGGELPPVSLPVVPPPTVAAGGGFNPLYLLAGLLAVPFLGGGDSGSPAETPPVPTPPVPTPPVPTPPVPTPPVTPPEPPAAVPEPSTTLGGIVAIGLGILMKRKYAKISSRKAAKTLREISQD